MVAFPGSSNGTAKGELDNIHPIQFHLQDMMTADLSRADVVVLTSLCWDEETRAAVVAKVCCLLYLLNEFVDITIA